jgi:hypothetical protein
MTAIVILPSDSELPVHRREYRIDHPGDEVVAIEKFLLRYHRVPEKVFVWRGVCYIELAEGEK